MSKMLLFMVLFLSILLLFFCLPWFKQTVAIAQEDEKIFITSTESQRDHFLEWNGTPAFFIGDSLTQRWVEVRRENVLSTNTDHLYGNDLHSSHSVENNRLLYPVVAYSITGTYETNDIRSISKAVEFYGTWESMPTREDLEPQNSSLSKVKTNEFPYGMFEDHIYFLSAPGSGENYAIFRPLIGENGCYEVYEWIECTIDEKGLIQTAINVPYEIHHSEGVTIGQINQKESMRQWNSLGMYYFNEGNDGFVKISNDADGNVIADTFRFKYVGNSCQ